MKKYFVLLSAMLVMAACAKGPQGNGTAVPEEESSAPVPVQLQANLPAVTPVTKSAIGALDKWHADQELYVYCIAREGLNSNASANAPLDLPDPENDKPGTILIDNVRALFPDGTFNPATPGTPQLVNVYRVNTEPYYYNEDRRYEFFAYYVDNPAGNAPAPTVGKNNISLAVSIDGSQDIMLAKTDKDADNVTDLNPNRLYSAYSARHRVTPNLVFKHLLSRFNVYVKSGDDPSVTDKITITSFTVRSKTDGTIFIAYKDHPAEEDEQHPNLTVSSDENNYAYLPIWNGANGGATQRLLYNPDDPDDDTRYNAGLTNTWPNRDNPLGTIMVMPYETEYEIQVGLKQTDYTAENETITTYTVKFADLLSPHKDPKDQNNDRPEITESELDTQALPGHQYDLNVVVYGLQAIQVTVSLQEWEDSGNFVVDQDEDQAIAINIPDLDVIVPPDTEPKGTLANPLPMTVGGADYQITATTVPENQTLTYSSSNDAVATVSITGLIHAVGAGDAKIIITATPTDKQPEGGYRVIRVHVTAN